MDDRMAAPGGRRWHPAARVLAGFLSFIVATIIVLLLQTGLDAVLIRIFGSAASPEDQNILVLSLIFLPVQAMMVVLTGSGIWLLMRYIDRRPVREAGWILNARSPLMFGLGLLLSLVIVLPASLILTALGWLRPGDSPAQWFQTILWSFSLAFLVQGIPEELVFRGYIMQTLGARPVRAWLVSSAFFGIIHLISNGGQQNLLERFIYLITPFGFGLLAGALVLRCQSVWPAIGIHGGFHVANWLGMPLQVGVGPVHWTVIGLIYIVVALIVFRSWQRQPQPEVIFTS